MPPKGRSRRNRSEDDEIEIRTNLSTFKPSPTKDIVKPTIFYGNLDEDIDSWLKIFDRIATANEWNRERKLNTLPAFLRDRAAEFYESLEDDKKEEIYGDYLTRWPEAIPVPNADATTTAKVFIEEVVCRHGAPRQLLSDNGKNFRSNLVKEICKLMNTKKTFTTAYHPETDGLVERFNGTLTAMLSMYVSGHQRDWDTFIPFVLFAYRTSLHESIQETPFF
ncbi:Hypothetical predicted protein [Mytilus galloprovincialis]|uniref:Integrase catalytic domain-containing protein n=1 Tax=Mytilus galloprovincialis TaxID=29158 RepID=A0A8B6D659_MYTGA|nr:Hypothetical predicted protein [Mytilus galloprovincialis]